MDSPTTPSTWQRSTTRRLLRWLTSWRTIRRVLVTLAWTGTVIALLYGEENWRGRRAWESYRRALESHGAQLDLKAFIPPPVPDEQNFAATPFITSWFTQRTHAAGQWQDGFSKADVKAPNLERRPRQMLDLAAWAVALRSAEGTAPKSVPPPAKEKTDDGSRAAAAQAVLEGLKSSEAHLDELRAASDRPSSRYPVTYNLENPWGILLPHLANVRAACDRLQLKACAELAASQSDRALTDVKLALRLVDSLREEIFLVSFVVRTACLQTVVQPVWEGLAEHRWSDAQLAELQTLFGRYDFLTDLRRPLDGECAAISLTAELLYRQKYRLSDLDDPSRGSSSSLWGTDLANLLGRLAPHGWYHQEQVSSVRLYQAQLAGAFDANAKRVWPGQIAANARELEQVISGGRFGKELNAVIHHHVFAALLLPSLSKLPLKAAVAQATADQAVIACALERHRLAEGGFPEKLGVLALRFIAQVPTDVLTGEPYRYRLTADGAFVLYSVGWDEHDDGGTPAPSLSDGQPGDWVW